jgi:hypothetical protein
MCVKTVVGKAQQEPWFFSLAATDETSVQAVWYTEMTWLNPLKSW